jgi:RHS repeat-associated protein
MGQADFPTAPGGNPAPCGYGDSPDTLSADTITLTMPVGTTTTCGTLAAINITGIGTSATPATSTPDGSWVQSSQAPDGTRTTTTYSGGRPLTVSRYASDGASLGTVTQGFDVLGRPAYSIDSRTGLSSTAYISATCDTVKSVTDPGSRTTSFTYDSRGNRLTTTLPDTTSIMHTSYDTYGRTRASWGSQTNPVFYEYDYAGRLKTLYTWKITPTLSQTTLTPPGTLGTPAAPVATRWEYDPASGLLTGKFHDYRDNNLTDGPAYAYTAAGRLQTRTWKRGITTGYYYSLAGDLIAVNYSDAATPDVLHTRDRLGRATKSAQGTLALNGAVPAVSNGTGISLTEIRSTTYGYNANLQIDTETANLGDGFPEKTLTRTYETAGSGRIVGRPNGYTFSGGSATWTYDAAGRPSTLTDNTDTFTYGYLPNSGGLIETVVGPAHTVTNTWETTRDVLATKVNTTVADSNDIPSSFAYGVNAIGQRETVGPVVVDSTPVSTYKPEWAWDYNDRGELIEAKDQTTAANHRAFQYDAIGNRQKTVSGLAAALAATPVNYEANALNQYIKANNVILPTLPAPAPYDQDGNLRFDGGVNPTAGTAGANAREYLWDAENRLTEVKIVGGATLVTYAYDHLSRLVSRTDSSGTTRYLYDGWNRIAEFAGTNLEKTYLWGMDLSGSMQGAGGVGGLLSLRIHDPQSAIYYPTFDGNGNVSEYLSYTPDNTETPDVNEETCTVAAHFEYDPFGNLTADSEVNAETFPYRFSTKPQDAVTGLYYYGYRYYDPLTGRWPSRDPIEEEGGTNLYGFVVNDGVNWIDVLGEEPMKTDKAGTIAPTVESGWKRRADGRWEKSVEAFSNDHMTEEEKEIGDTKPYKNSKLLDWGCKGVTHAMLQKTDVSLKDCYLKEEDALEAAKNLRCDKSERGGVFGVRYYDPQKEDRKADGWGRYPVSERIVSKGKPGTSFTRYDYGYRQKNGSYIHADHAPPGMNVLISPSSKEFAKNYDGFNTTVYCTRCCKCIR